MAYDLSTATIHESDTGKSFTKRFILWPRQWCLSPPDDLKDVEWKSVPFDESNLASLPNTPGVYAFIVKPSVCNLSGVGYLMYIGKAEGQSLSTRCSQYLQEPRKKKPRILICDLLNKWRSHLHLYYATIPPGSTITPTKVENFLLTAFMPPANTVLPGTLTVIAKSIYRA